MGNNEEEACNTGLELGFGLYSSTQTKKDDDHDQKKNMIKKNKPLILFDLLPKENHQGSKGYLKPIINTDHEEKRKHCIESNNKKVNYDFFVDNDDDDGDDSHKHGGRKKLKLTKDQATLLEDYFKLNTTLDPASKQALADRLNLKPRQVSVWFQNRRARTKLKKTEEDYQSLKKCCENLSHENRRLKKELQELRLLKIEPLSNELRIHQVPNNTTPAKLIKCFSCEKIS